jgi:hypothetical protein
MNKSKLNLLAYTLDSNDAKKVSAPSPLQIYVVYDDDESANKAEVLINRVAGHPGCEMRLSSFGRLTFYTHFIEAARAAANADLLVMAVRSHCSLPSRVKSWIGLWFALRARSRDGALVALFTDPNSAPHRDCGLLAYLKAIATMAGLAFFSGCALKDPDSVAAPSVSA